VVPVHALNASVWQLVLSPVPAAPLHAPAPHCPWFTHLPLVHCASAVQRHALCWALHAPMLHA